MRGGSGVRTALDYLGLLSPNGGRLNRRATPHQTGCSACSPDRWDADLRRPGELCGGASGGCRWGAPRIPEEGEQVRGCSVNAARRVGLRTSDRGIPGLRLRQGQGPVGPGTVLPQVWAGDVERRREAGVPEDAVFRTKPQLAQGMLERALESGVPFGWVTGDEVYGKDRNLRLWRSRREFPMCWPSRATRNWVSDGEGTPTGESGVGSPSRGNRLGQVPRAMPRVPGSTTGPPWRYGPWGREGLEHPSLMSWPTTCASARPVPQWRSGEAGRRRWAIEECFEEAKGQVDLDQTRYAVGIAGIATLPWRLAHAYPVIRHQASAQVCSVEKGAAPAVMQG